MPAAWPIDVVHTDTPPTCKAQEKRVCKGILEEQVHIKTELVKIDQHIPG